MDDLQLGDPEKISLVQAILFIAETWNSVATGRINKSGSFVIEDLPSRKERCGGR